MYLVRNQKGFGEVIGMIMMFLAFMVFLPIYLIVCAVGDGNYKAAAVGLLWLSPAILAAIAWIRWCVKCHKEKVADKQRREKWKQH